MTNNQHHLNGRKAITPRNPRKVEEFKQRVDILVRPHVARVVKALVAGTKIDRETTRLSSEEWLQARYEAEKQRNPSVDEKHLTDAFNIMRPKIVSPSVIDKPAAFAQAWSQPEAVELFEKWWPQGIRDRDRPVFEAAKGTLLLSAALGNGRFKTGYADMKHPTLEKLFQELAQATSRQQMKPVANPVALGAYSNTTTNIAAVSPMFPPLAMETCIQVVRELREMYPNIGVGCYGSVDGTDAPAWLKQGHSYRNGKHDDELEERRLRRMPTASFKAYTHTNNGKDDETGESTFDKGWRGYLFVLLVDVITGLPLVGQWVTGKAYETHVLQGLLDTLYGFWPDCPMEALVGDKLWDEQAVNLMCERNYGIHMVAIRKPRSANAKPRDVTLERNRIVGQIDGLGRGICRAHGELLPLTEVNVPNRAALGLQPGEPAPESHFRYRYGGCCGRPGVPMSLHPSAMTFYPHYAEGRPKLYAMRKALEGCGRNQSEAAFSSLKQGGLAVTGAARIRTLSEDNFQASVWAHLVTRSLTTLAAERQRFEEGEIADAA